MPARTYEQHKAAVDISMPTPPVAWKLHPDDPAHSLDDHALAECIMYFNGREYIHRLHYQLKDPQGIAWHFYLAGLRGETWGFDGNVGGHTWLEAETSFTLGWEKTCEAARVAAAHEAWARDVLVNDGITYGVVNLSGLNIWGPAQAAVSLTPIFAGDTLVYAASTNFDNVSLRAAATEGSTITWEVGGGSITGPLVSFDLPEGDTVVTVTVSQFEYTPTTYTVTITRNAEESE